MSTDPGTLILNAIKVLSDKIDGYFGKATTPPGPDPKPVIHPASERWFNPTSEDKAAFCAANKIDPLWLDGNAPEQAAITDADPFKEIPWPRIAPLKNPNDIEAAKEYLGMRFLPNGLHVKGSRMFMRQTRNSAIAIAAAPSSDAAERVLTGAGNADGWAVCMALLGGLVTFPLFASPQIGGGVTTPEIVLARLNAAPPVEAPFDPTKPGPGIAGR